MSFLKGIFGATSKDDRRTPTHAAATNRNSVPAPPARPFPTGFTPQQQQQQQQHPSAHSHPQTQHPAHHSYAQQTHAPQQPQPTQQFHAPQPPQQPAPVAMGGSGGDMFDLFDGLSLKVAPAAAAEDASPAMANGHTDSSSVAPSANGAAVSAGMDMDMFSGLTVSSGDDAANSADGGSLLSMISGDNGNAESAHARESSSGEQSGFSFVTETSADDDAAAASSDQAGPSSFSFLSSDATTEENTVEPADTAATNVDQTEVALATLHSDSTRDPSVGSEVSSPSLRPSPAVAAPAPSSTRSSFSGPPPSFSSPPGVTSPPSRKVSSATAAPTFEQIHSQIDSSLTTYWTELKSINLTQSALRTRQLTLQSTLQSARAELISLESQQQTEIEQENYEGADQINSQIEALKQRLTQLDADIAQSARNLSDHGQHKSNLRKLTRVALEEALRQYQSLTKQYTFQMTHAITSETQLLEQKEDILITDLERTRRNLAHTLTDLETVDQEEARIAERITNDTREMTEEHDVLCTQLAGLEAERDHLRALLAAKDEEVAMCAQKIDVVVTGISGKRANHEKKLARTHEKKARLQQEQAQATQEEQTLLESKAALEADFHRVAAQEKGSTRKLKKMQEEVVYVQAIINNKLNDEPESTAAPSVPESEEATSPSSASSLALVANELSSLQQQLSLTLGQLDESRLSLASLEVSIDTHTKSLDAVAARIPSLEAEKNLAVATRDFKKAAQASKEVKLLQTQKADMETQLQELRAQGATLNESLTALSDAKVKLAEQITALESEADKKRLVSFLKSRLELASQSAQVEQMLARYETERAEEQSLSAASPTSPATSAVSTHIAAILTAHHFQFLTHERDAYAVEEETLAKEVSQLRERHGWDDAYLEEEARTELAAERRQRGEAPLEDTAAVDAQAQEESSITEQRRKDRNAAIAAAAAAAASEESADADATDATASEAASSPVTASESVDAAVASPTSATEPDGGESESALASPVSASVDAAADDAAEPIAAESDAQTTPQPESASVTDDASSAHDVEPVESPVPSGPSEETIAAWRSTHTQLAASIISLESSLQQAIETEEFDEADRIETELVQHRSQQETIETDAKAAGVELASTDAADETASQEAAPAPEEAAE